MNVHRMYSCVMTKSRHLIGVDILETGLNKGEWMFVRCMEGGHFQASDTIDAEVEHTRGLWSMDTGQLHDYCQSARSIARLYGQQTLPAPVVTRWSLSGQKDVGWQGIDKSSLDLVNRSIR